MAVANAKLQKLLGKGFSVAACVGLVIGLGILRTPGEIATTISTPVPYISLWIGAGLFVLLSLLVVAELIAMTPRSGGIYSMVAHAYGPYPGFLIGWTDWISTCATIALKSVVLLEYVSLLLPAAKSFQTAGAILITSFFAFLQLGGVRLGAGIQRAAAIGIGLIMIGLAAALFFGLFLYGGQIEAPTGVIPVGPPGLASFGLVIAAVVFTYDGWYAASYFSEEVIDGGRAVAIASIQGALIVFALYITLNLAIVMSVPLSALVGHDLALAGALEIVYGAQAGAFVMVAAVFILLAHQNLQYMIASRILYSVSADGLGSESATSVNAKGTPAGATIFSWLATCVLILAGKFEFLLNLVAILFMAMYVGLIVGVFRLRKQEPDTERSFRAWGYPATGVICAIGWLAVAIFVAVTNPVSALSGLLLTGVSVPVYYWLRNRRNFSEST